MSETVEKDPERMGFVMLVEVFHRFGYEHDAIPFQKGGKLDGDAIRSL